MTKRCPACDGIGYLMGQLGLLKWFRCGDCGIDFNSKVRRKAVK